MEQNFLNLKNGAAPGSAASVNVDPAARQQNTTELPYAYLDAGLKKIFGNDFALDDRMAQDFLLHYLYQYQKQNESLRNMLESDPRLAQMMLDMMYGKRNATGAVARYFGRSLVELDENSPEYQEMMRADEERQMEAARMAGDLATR